MKYRVEWSAPAEQVVETHLFLALETGRSTHQLKSAVRRMNELLAREPLTAGESRDGERIVFVEPLWVVYEPFESERVALIYWAKVRLPNSS